jgi:predicted nucleic acid-binding protein
MSLLNKCTANLPSRANFGHAVLRHKALHQPVPNQKSERDVMIASTALVHGLILVSRNEKDLLIQY